MAGPGIRYYHLSRVLSQYTSLKLAILPQDDQALAKLQAKLPNVSVIEYQRRNWDSIKEAAEWAEIIILSPYLAHDLFQLKDLPAVLVIDGYDPLLFEWLTTLSREEVLTCSAEWSTRMTMLFSQYLSADFFICASERQRYWWLGQLEVAGRINPVTYQQDPSLRNLVDVVPYGLPETPAQHTRRVVKGVWPGIEPDDVLLLWGGGLWPWLDPLTAVRAVEQLRSTHPHLKLIFPGTIHPNPKLSGLPVHNTQIYAYVAEQGLLNKAVFFGEWVPYNDWPNILLESDIALSLHHETVETELAYRSRILEYIWAGVPIVATRGDATSTLVSKYNLGAVVDYQDVSGVTQAILNILAGSQERYQASLAVAREELTWEKATRPLIQFCLNPRRAADRQVDPLIGVPYYKGAMVQQQAEIAHLKQLVAAYENGRFMRFMRAFHHFRSRLRGNSIL
jgi:glycosyltransferase involved in cell wall biosynthesis